MVNTNNTKFTFNKKGLALSLACVGLLATAGNAEITGDGVTKVNGSNTNYNVTVTTLSGATTITVTGKDNTLGFSGGAATISGGVTLTGTGNLKDLNLFHVSGGKTLTLKNALDINVDTTTMNIGSSADGKEHKFIISGGTINFGSNTFDKVNLNHVEFSSGGSIVNAGTIKDMVIGEKGFSHTSGDKTAINFENKGNIGTLTNNATIYGSGAAVGGKIYSGAITFTMGNVGIFNQNGTIQNITITSGTGTIGTFNNKGEISSNGSGAYTLGVKATDFNNAGKINFASGAALGTINITADNFKNAKDAQIDFQGAKGGLTITANKSFDNAGTIKGVSGGSTTNAGTITLKDTESATNSGLIQVDTISFSGMNKSFENSGVISGGNISGADATDRILTFTNTASGAINNSTIKVNVDDFKNAGTITTAASSTINVYNSFDNAENANFTLNGTLALNGAADVKDAKTTFNNAGLFSGGTINIVNNVLTFNNATTGVIKNSTISGAGTIQTFKNEGTITNSTLAKNLTIGTLDNSGVIDNSTITITVNDFKNAGKITALANSTITVNKTFNNAGTLSGGTITLAGADSVRNATFAGTNSGLIQASTISFSGIHKSFENSGTISGGTISGANTDARILTFNNTATGAIKGSTIKVGINDFNNLGSVATGTGSDIKVYNSFNNADKASFMLNGTLTLEGAARDSKTTFNNAGNFSNGTISIVNNVLAFNNTATGEIKGTEISGAGTIQTLTNAGVMNVKANKANVAAFQNTNEFTLSGGGTLNVLNSFNNAEKAIFAATSASDEKIQLGNGKNANTTETTFANAGTIDGKGKLKISQSGGWVKSFTNTGLIDKTTITSGGATNGIVTFANSGTIDNSTLQVNVVNFNNLEGGLIDFRGAANSSINLSGALDKTASFNNAGTIDNLASAISVDDKVTNVSFKNSGTIYQSGGANAAVLSLTGASNILDFNNSGTIALAGTNTSGAITAVAGAKANIINTGAITLGNGGAHMDLTSITPAKDAPFVVKEWHLSNIGSADSYNGNYKSDGRDKIVVKGFSGGITTGTSNLRFDKGSIVIDPIKNTGMVSGQPYLLDRIVVNESGNPVEEVYKIDTATNTVTSGGAITTLTDKATGKFKLNDAGTQYVLKEGETDPRLVTINTIRSSDPIFELYGVDAYGAAPTGSGGAIDITKLGKVGEVADATTGAKYVGDGIIDSFQIGVNASKGAGAAVVQSAVNNSITRNAFVGNVINTAVNSALASLNNFNRVSYNDEEVDFSELEKYAAVSSDVTDQTYAKDSNVYVMPYYRSTSVDLAGGSLDADTYGIVLGGNKNLGEGGVIGLFLGYENADGSANNVDTEDDTFFGGINYYKTLGGTSTYDYFVKGMLRLANTSSDVTRKNVQNNGTSSADTFSYGIEANAGMNFYNGIHTITPEVGLSYDRVEVDGFKLNGIDYNDNNINLVMGKIVV